MHAPLYNALHVNRHAILIFSADDGGVSGTHADVKSQEISSFEEVDV
jgi:hypothetical protein